MNILDVRAKFLAAVDKTEEERKTYRLKVKLPQSFQYTFTEKSGFDELFQALPKSIQHRMISIWYDNGEPAEILMNVERWNPERRPGMGRFEVTPIFTKKNTLQPYENMRKVLLRLAGTEL